MIELQIERLEAGGTRIIDDLRFKSNSRCLHVEGGIGTGKTLLSRALCGDFLDSTVYQVSGNAMLGGTAFRLPRATAHESAAHRTAYIPQNATSFFISTSVRGEIFVSSTGSAAVPADIERIYANWKHESPLASRVEIPPLALSGGQQKLLMLEAVVASSPSHIVIDGGMDAFDGTFRERARLVVSRWLDENQDRTLLYFSLPNSRDWLPFSDKLVLGLPHSRAKRPNFNAASAIAARQVVVNYGHVTAGPMIGKRPLLDDILLQVKEGEFVALHGANGVGKSTLLRLLAGVVQVRRGKIEFCGKSIRRMRWPGLRGGVGYLPQEPELAGPYAIRTASFEREKKRRLAQWNEWAALFDLKWNGSWGDYWTMSAGQRAQAALLVQLVGQPRFWMFDEPTTRLDPTIVLELFAKLRTAQPSLAALVVSHNDAFLDAACDRHVELTPSGIVQL